MSDKQSFVEPEKDKMWCTAGVYLRSFIIPIVHKRYARFSNDIQFHPSTQMKQKFIYLLKIAMTLLLK